MDNCDQLLDQARQFCDPSTGEVLQRIPEELMHKLRGEKLARGIPGKANKNTGSYATWFVFLNSDIRDHVMREWRQAQRSLNRKRRQRTAVANASSQSTCDPDPPANQGLKRLVQRIRTEQ